MTGNELILIISTLYILVKLYLVVDPSADGPSASGEAAGRFMAARSPTSPTSPMASPNGTNISMYPFALIPKTIANTSTVESIQLHRRRPGETPRRELQPLRCKNALFSSQPDTTHTITPLERPFQFMHRLREPFPRHNRRHRSHRFVGVPPRAIIQGA